LKKLNSKNILYLFIISLPILDMSSFIFRNFFSTTFSPSTFIRPIIPIILIVLIFFKYKFKLKTILIGIIYGIYTLVHLYVFNKLNYGISYGTITHELQYLVNYTFSILNLFIFLFVFYKGDTKNITKSILIANGIYILSIYISIFTKTSSTTYLEGMGFKGWFESGNSLSTILVLNLFIVFILFNKLENKKIKLLAFIEVISSGIFLTFLLGTRTGLFGFVLILSAYLFSKIFILFRDNFINNEKKLEKNKKILLIICSILITVIVGLVLYKGSSLLSRRKYLNSLNFEIIDSTTNSPSHVTGDILKFKEQIQNNSMDNNYMPETMQTSIIELYDFANSHNIAGTDRRTQQLIYNANLVKNQSNIFYMIFGNGFLNNYGELTLEMEIPAFLFNFGILGFVLYFIPFLSLFIYYVYIGINNIKKIDAEYIFLCFGILLSFVLSFLVGQIFFNSSAMIIITCMNVLLYNKCINLKNNKTNINTKKQIVREPALIK
jgi:hypothetical protein